MDIEKSICPACGEKIHQSGFNTANEIILKCESCLLHFVQKKQILDKQFIKRYEEGNFWNDTNYDIEKMIKTDFTDTQGKHFALNWTSMFEYCKRYLSKKQKILEIGVGTGVHMIMFDKNGYDVTGVEPDTRNATLITKQLTHGKCISGFYEKQDFQDEFDVIWLFHVMEHILDPEELLRRCKTFLKNNGLIIIAVPDCENPDTLKRSIGNPDHLWHFTKSSLSTIFSKFNCKIEKCDSMALIADINKQRINDRSQKYKFNFLTKKIWPFWPLEITKQNNAKEIRMILRIQKNKIMK